MAAETGAGRGWGALPDALRALPELTEGSATRLGVDPSLPLADGSGPSMVGDNPTIASLAAGLGRVFARPALLRVAVTHPGWANEHRKAGWPSNGCLEFYGDAVLDLLAADAIWRRFPEMPEGDLTRLRASLVSEASLAAIAREIELGAYLYLGKGDEKNGFRDHPATLADALEAVLGAVFLDAKAAGDDPMFAAARSFDALFGRRVAHMSPTDGLDPKSALQRVVQAKLRVAPRYRQVGEAPAPGEPPHWRVVVELRRKGEAPLPMGDGEGRSLQEAERQAAAVALAKIRSGELVI